MNMTNLDEGAIRHLISIHEEEISQLKLQIAKLLILHFKHLLLHKSKHFHNHLIHN